MFGQLSDLQSDLHALKGRLSGELRLCLVNTAQYVVPPLLKTFLKQYPEVKVSLHVVNRAGAIERLANNSDDLVVMGLVPSDRPLTILPFLDNVMVPVMTADFKLKGKGAMTLSRFLQQPLLMRETGSGSRLALEQYCQQQHLTAQPFMEMGSIETLKQGVLAGLGVAVVPKLSVQTELNLGLMKIVPVKDFALRRSWCLVYPKGKHLSPAAQAFATFIQDNLAAINKLFSH